jgi:hypothetical protein
VVWLLWSISAYSFAKVANKAPLVYIPVFKSIFPASMHHILHEITIILLKVSKRILATPTLVSILKIPLKDITVAMMLLAISIRNAVYCRPSINRFIWQLKLTLSFYLNLRINFILAKNLCLALFFLTWMASDGRRCLNWGLTNELITYFKFVRSLCSFGRDFWIINRVV